MFSRLLTRLRADSKFVMPFAVLTGSIIGFMYKVDEERREKLAQFMEMQEFRDELNVNAIKGLKQDGIYIKLLELQDKIDLRDQRGQIIATQQDLANNLSFLIVGSLDDNAFLVNFYKLKAFLEKQKAHHTQRIADYVKETGQNIVDRATYDLIDYKLFPIVTTENEITLKNNEKFYFADSALMNNLTSVFQQNHAYIIGEQKSVGLLLDLSLPFEDLQQQIVGFSILQGVYIARRQQLFTEYEASQKEATSTTEVSSSSGAAGPDTTNTSSK